MTRATSGKGQMPTAEQIYYATQHFYCISTVKVSAIKAFWYKVAMTTCASVEQSSAQLSSGYGLAQTALHPNHHVMLARLEFPLAILR